ncbi:MAG: hypothetical protein RL625_1637 [Gemmatimonadota bacterium]|jgi:hypothetical protein
MRHIPRLTVLFLTFLRLVGSTTLQAQRIAASPVGRISRVPSGGASADTTPRADRPAISAGFVLEQTAAASGGFAAGALVGGLVGGVLASAGSGRSAGGFEGLIGMIGGAVLAGPVGAGIAVNRFSRARGVEGRTWAGITGGYLGWFGGPAFYFTVPLGTVTAYNLSRR